MRLSTFILTFLLFTVSLSAQSVDCSRSANLTGSNVYDTEGTAYLERFDDGSIRFSLGEDFMADIGPDVQIYLANDSTSIAGGVMIADIGQQDGLNHFSGAMSFDVPGNVMIDTYSFVVFRCITFSAYWGGGRLSVPSCEGGPDMPMDTTMSNPPMCLESLVATTDWVSEVTVCPNDGIADLVELRTNIEVELDENYSFLITDINNKLLEVVDATEYNFEGTSLETQYVFGVFYRGELSFSIGDPINTIMADTCALLSSPTVFLTINKTNCVTTFDCIETVTATTNWTDLVDICPTDGIADSIPFINNQAQVAGEHYAYVVTDSIFAIEEVLFQPYFDFESSGLGTQYVLGVSYGGTLNYTLGAQYNTITSDSCLALSDTTRYLTVTKNACIPTVTTRRISGKVTNQIGVGIANVTIQYTDELSTLTDDQGNYSLGGLPTDSDIVISAARTENASNGISAVDIILVRRHILGIEVFSDPLQLLAADVNDNQSISAIDLVEMQRVLLDLSSEFGVKPSWQFVDASIDLNIDVLTNGVSPNITIPAGMTDLVTINFVGVKTGDVNESASPH